MNKLLFALLLFGPICAPAQTTVPLGALGGSYVSQGLSRPMGGPAPKEPERPSGPGVSWFSYPVYIQAPAPSPAVVINQYLAPPAASPALEKPVEAKVEPTPVPHRYVIAYRDQKLYMATDWWIEGDVLHYITPRNGRIKEAHNQASLSLIDLELTTKLSRR